MIKYKVNNVESVELVIQNTGVNRINFPEIPELRERVIKRIDFVLGLVLDIGPPQIDILSPSGRTLIQSAVAQNVLLILQRKSLERLNRYPVQILNPGSTGGEIRYNINSPIDWEKSYIEFTSLTGLTVNQSILFNIYYERREDIKLRNMIRRNRKLRRMFAFGNYSPKVEDIEVIIDDTTKNRFYFPDDDNLRGKKVIQLFSYQNSTLSTTPSGRTTVPDTVFFNSFLVFRIRGRDAINKIPLQTLRQSFQKEDNRIDLDHLLIDWPNSYVEVAPSSDITLTANQSFFLNVVYHD